MGNDAARFDVDDFTVALIRLEGGITLDFRMSWAMHMDTMGDTIFLGTDAGLKVKSPGLGSNWGGAWDGGVGPISLFHDIAGTCVETPIPFKDTPAPGIFERKVRAFVDAVLNNGSAPIPTSQILYNQAIVDGIYRSSQAGREVEIVIPNI
jgi:predicted dehydrogenase